MTTMFNLNTGFAISALQRHQMAMNKSLERLATGKQINRASDDPAGLMRADSLMFDIRKIEKNLEAGEMAFSFVGAADGALSVVADMLLQLKGLVVSAANRGAMSGGEREALQIEADAILDGISLLTNTTVFRGQRLLAEGFAFRVGSAGVAMSGIGLTTLGSVSRESDSEEGKKDPGSQTTSSGASGGANGANITTHETFSIANIRSGGTLNLVSGDLELASRSVDAAINGIATTRAGMGAALRGVSADMAVWQVELESLTGAHSDLVDLDYAKETSQLIRTQLMRDAAMAAVLIGRENAQKALDLLVNSAKSMSNAGPIRVPSVRS